MRPLTTTNPNLISLGVFLIRVMIGLILFVAGAGKALGWFNGMGIDITIQMFRDHVGISAPWGYISTYAEFIGGALLFIGLFTRVAAFILAINMCVAVIVVGMKDFFGPQGAAYPCLIFVGCVLIALTGPMKISLDAVLERNRNNAH